MKLEPAMSIERAMEILDPTHRERYESIEPVNEACRMGRDALRLRLPKPLYQDALATHWSVLSAEAVNTSTTRTETRTSFAASADRRSPGSGSKQRFDLGGRYAHRLN